jgi:hypothetical protein
MSFFPIKDYKGGREKLQRFEKRVSFLGLYVLRGRRLGERPPQEENGDAEQDDDQPRPGVAGLKEKKVDGDGDANDDIEGRDDGVAEGFVRTHGLGLLFLRMKMPVTVRLKKMSPAKMTYSKRLL